MTIKNKLSHTNDDQRFWRKRMKALTFGQTVRAYRLAEDWSLTFAAEKIGISKQQLSDYEHGRKASEHCKSNQIAKALDMMPQGLVLQVINEQLRNAEIPIQVAVASWQAMPVLAATAFARCRTSPTSPFSDEGPSSIGY